MSGTDTVFISYRRNPSAGWAQAVSENLRYHDYDVFFDVESIGAGKFADIILRQIAARKHFIVILQTGALERCGEKDDWLRREIEYAIDCQRNLVPLVIEGFSLEDEKQHLTGKLSQLLNFQFAKVPSGFFREAMEKLRNTFLQQPFTGSIVPSLPEDQAMVKQTTEAAALDAIGIEVKLPASAVNVRLGPNVAQPLITRLPAQGMVQIVGRNADRSWWLVRHSDVVGWISDSVISPPSDAEIDSIPVKG